MSIVNCEKCGIQMDLDVEDCAYSEDNATFLCNKCWEEVENE